MQRSTAAGGLTYLDPTSLVSALIYEQYFADMDMFRQPSNKSLGNRAWAMIER